MFATHCANGGEKSDFPGLSKVRDRSHDGKPPQPWPSKCFRCFATSQFRVNTKETWLNDLNLHVVVGPHTYIEPGMFNLMFNHAKSAQKNYYFGGFELLLTEKLNFCMCVSQLSYSNV